jgi:uncharacterized protein YjiS (DUF1127 family)
MRNENRAVFDRASEPYDLAMDSVVPALPHPAPKAGREEVETDEAAEIASSPKSILPTLLRKFVARLRARRNRLALLELSEEQLKDIGLSRSQAYGDPYRDRLEASHGLERRCR